jgi:cytochrome c oxidase cbb3-type subunit II
LYATHCQACHQPNGEGLKGAFPPLKGSAIVLDENPARLITIIMKGYDGRVNEGYAVMPPIGTLNQLKPGEIRAIINHERGSWGNRAPAVSLETVQATLNSL